MTSTRKKKTQKPMTVPRVHSITVTHKLSLPDNKEVLQNKQIQAQKKARTKRATGIIATSLTLCVILVVSTMLPHNMIASAFGQLPNGDAGVIMENNSAANTEQTPVTTTEPTNIINSTEPVNETIDATININTTDPTQPTEEPQPPFFAENIEFECKYIIPPDKMPYAFYTPSSVNPEKPTALLVWLHGSGERNVDYNTFLNRGLPAVLANYSLSGFNAYILAPHLTGDYDNTWNSEKSKSNLKTLLDFIIEQYNIDINNIVLTGHSLGGQGVLYMTHELPEYFNRAAVLSGYDPGISESKITTPLIAYVGTHNAGEDDSSIRYTMTTLTTTFGDNNVKQIMASHGELPHEVFTLDINADNQADIIKWLFQELAADIKEPKAPTAKSNSTNSVPLFFQTDYPDIPYSQGTVATSGCGISCLSMVASYQTDVIYTPGMLAKYNDSGYDNGTRMENAAIALGLHFETTWRWSRVIEALKNDQLVIVLVGSDTIFTSGGHFIVLTGITDDGLIMVNDPYEPNYHRIGSRYFTGFEQEEFTCGFNGAWIFDKKE